MDSLWQAITFMGSPAAMEMIHKVHHANQSQYIDRNFAQVLIAWDRLFGTYAPIEDEPIPASSSRPMITIR